MTDPLSDSLISSFELSKYLSDEISLVEDKLSQEVPHLTAIINELIRHREVLAILQARSMETSELAEKEVSQLADLSTYGLKANRPYMLAVELNKTTLDELSVIFSYLTDQKKRMIRKINEEREDHQ